MQFQLAEGILFGLSGAQVALMIAAVAIIFALRRWRQVAAHRRALDARGMKSYEEIERRPQAPGPAANPLNVREVATELSALLADLEETARRVAAQIDNRRTGLEILLREADQKIKRLEELTRAAAGNTNNTAPIPLAAQPKPTALIGTAIDAAKTLSRLRQERGAPVAAEDPAYQPIFQLADRGKSVREIAQELGRQPGEVELILALRGRQRVG